MRRHRGVAVLLFLVPLALPAAVRAQLAPDPDGPPASTAPAAPAAPAATLRMNANLVDLFFTVRDKDGRLVPHLTANDCTVSEDNVAQRLNSFDAAADQPLTLGILLDTSGSQSRVLPLEQEAGSRFLERVLGPKDEAFLLSFDVNVNLLQDLTGDVQLLKSAMNKAEINDAGGNGAGGLPGAGGGTVPIYGAPRGTLLYDAVTQAVNDRMSQETGRKALILLTDGQDEGSRAKIGDAIAAAQNSGVPVYVILIADRHFYGDGDYGGRSAMKKLTGETGGRLIDAGNGAGGDRKKLDAAFQEIEDELRTQYLAAYTPANTAEDGSFRSISVVCRGDGLKVQVRKGYFAAPPEN